MRKILILFLAFFLAQCGTQVPTERKVTKVENIVGTPKKVFLEEKSEKVKDHLISKKINLKGQLAFEFKIKEQFKIPEVLMREDIARSYVTKKKRGTMVHNPIGEGTGSIFAFGMIELWCLSEWMATALPGKQKNIYLDKCKERYVGTKTKTTEDKISKTILNKTGNYKTKYQDYDTGSLDFTINNSSNYSMNYELERACDGKNLKEFGCGKRYVLTANNIAEKLLIDNDNPIINNDYVAKVSFEGLEEEVTFPKKQIEKAILDVKEIKRKEKEKLKIAKLKEKEEQEKKERELKERYKPVAAWNGSGFFINAEGYIITNNHVIEDTSVKNISGKCDEVNAFLDAEKFTARIISQDRLNDLALLKIKEKTRIKKFANFRNKSVVLGEKVVAMGYPYGKTVSSEIKLTSGSVSSLSGLGDEFTRMQIDAALQPGNSGGPLFDKAGNVIGVAVAKASLWAFLEAFGTLPENVNFGIKPSVVKTFLDSNNIRYTTKNYNRDIGTEKIAEKGSDNTVYIECLIRKDKLTKINKQREKN